MITDSMEVQAGGMAMPMGSDCHFGEITGPDVAVVGVGGASQYARAILTLPPVRRP